MPVQGIIGKKLGMTQIFSEDGRAIPATVIEAGPCVVVQRKSIKKNKNNKRDGYSAVQLGLVDATVRNVTKPQQGHYEKTGGGLPPCRLLRELRVDEADEAKVGDEIKVADVFAPGDTVFITGTSQGKGFQGVMKRHNFSGGRASHGSMFHRAPGSTGQSAYPSRTLKGLRAPGHMGDRRVTVPKLEVVQLDAESNLMIVKGAVPGAKGGYLVIQKRA